MTGGKQVAREMHLSFPQWTCSSAPSTPTLYEQRGGEKSIQDPGITRLGGRGGSVWGVCV